MAETAETNFDESKRKNCARGGLVENQGLHKLRSVFEGVKERFIPIIYINMRCLINHVNMHSLKLLKS